MLDIGRIGQACVHLQLINLIKCVCVSTMYVAQDYMIGLELKLINEVEEGEGMGGGRVP